MFGRKRSRPAGMRVREIGVAVNTVVWAIGDIHGQDDLFEAIMPLILADLERARDCRRKVILLGDYIDRGLGSARVLDQIIELRPRLEADGIELVTLMGNHEALLLQFIDQPQSGPGWMTIGGRETLLSYEIEVPSLGDVDGWAKASSELLQAMPLSHLEFLEGLPCFDVERDYFFVHAGVRPGVKLDSQSPQDMMWIRDPFLKDSRTFDKMIVHGHTPVDDVYVDDRRICLDTGGYATGVLSALRLQGRTHLVVQTRRSRGRVKLQSRPLVPD